MEGTRLSLEVDGGGEEECGSKSAAPSSWGRGDGGGSSEAVSTSLALDL